MKIVQQRVFVANASRTNFVFVKLYTDAGIAPLCSRGEAGGLSRISCIEMGPVRIRLA
jgi:hypothetical protein